MPIYEYLCHTCTSRFEMLRAIGRIDEDATCPQGHGGGKRVLSLVASIKQSVDYDFDYMADYDDSQEPESLPGRGELGCACGSAGCGSCN